MVLGFNTEDYLGAILVAYILARFGLWCRPSYWTWYSAVYSRYYAALAQFYHLVALLARTEIVILIIFLYLLVEDAFHTIRYHISSWVLAKVSIPGRLALPTVHQRPTYPGVQYPSPLNNQLRTWIEDDAENSWKLSAEALRDNNLMRQELRATYRALATWDPDEEVVD